MEYKDFESAFDDLKKIVQEFENSDNLSMDDLIKNYEQGMNAYTYCMKKLENTQKKIQIIDSNFE
ncbi:MAG: exodeoxyribonuclease VII small subunit [Tissierellia bacterium]|nr:exodeoxyribonuclease VII small subunit [Tissierellia bacterium]MDD4780795.1 exodeoxyribonuclease VII small subunit [Tissierellia bacterium]